MFRMTILILNPTVYIIRINFRVCLNSTFFTCTFLTDVASHGDLDCVSNSNLLPFFEFKVSSKSCLVPLINWFIFFILPEVEIDPIFALVELKRLSKLIF